MYLFGIMIALSSAARSRCCCAPSCGRRARRSSTQDTYNKIFTLHGAIMVFLVIIPGIPAALGNIILPIQLGAKDVAFPRLNLTSFYMWSLGALLLVGTIAFGGLDTGWTFYTPYSLESKTRRADRDRRACSSSASRRSSPA